jgi:hypothetical protein
VLEDRNEPTSNMAATVKGPSRNRGREIDENRVD